MVVPEHKLALLLFLRSSDRQLSTLVTTRLIAIVALVCHACIGTLVDAMSKKSKERVNKF